MTQTSHSRPPQRPPKGIVPQSTWIYFPEAHVYSWFGLIEHLVPLGLGDLAGEGMVRVDQAQPQLLTVLKGQLARLLTVGAGNHNDIWTERGALDQIERFPVVLAFRQQIAPPEPLTPLAVFQALPPPTLGECALLWNGSDWTLVEKTILPPESFSLHLQLRDAIADLAAPADTWWTERDLLAALAEEHEGDQARAHLDALLGQQKRRRAAPARWEADWQTLRLIARQLAQAYWTAANQGPLRMAVVDTHSPGMSLPADHISQQIMRSLLNPAEFHADQTRQSAVWEPPLMERVVTITLSQEEGETWQHMMECLSQLGDEAVDTFCALLALALATNGSGDLARPFYLGPDTILAMMGRQESSRIYTPTQRALIIRILNTLARIQVSATVPRAGKRKRVLRLNSAILDLHSGTIGEYTLDGEILWQKRLVSLGNWAALAPHLSHQTVLMLRRVLAYHPQRERFAKRLGRYLTLQLASGEAIELAMNQLITQSGITINRNNAQRTRQSIEHALQELVADGILGSATRLIDDSPSARAQQQRIDQCSQGWWNDYEQQSWLFTPPPPVREPLPLPGEG